MASVDLIKHLGEMIVQHQNQLNDMREKGGSYHLAGIPYITGYLHALEHIRDLIQNEVESDGNPESKS